MKITRDNYEIYFIDYQDGSLPPEDIRELKTFLLINPDLEELLEKSEQVLLPDSPEHFANKEILKKDLCHECPDYYAIAAAENELTDKDRKALGKNLNTVRFKVLTQTYERLKLKPDTSIRFENKSSLYQRIGVTTFFYRVAGVAAIMLIVWGMHFIYQQKPKAIIVAKHTEQRTVSSISQPDSIIPQKEPIKASIRKEKNITLEIPKVYSTVDTPRTLDLLTPISPTSLPLAKVTNNDVSLQDLELILPEKSAFPELYLSENANEWKQSEPGFFSNNIFISAINTGKNIKEKIKERIDFYRSNKSPLLSVIQENINTHKTENL